MADKNGVDGVWNAKLKQIEAEIERRGGEDFSSVKKEVKDDTVTKKELLNKVLRNEEYNSKIHSAPMPGLREEVNKVIKPGYEILFDGVSDLFKATAKEVKNMTYDKMNEYFKDDDTSSIKATVGLLNNSVASSLEIAGSPYTAAKMFTDWLVFGESKGDSIFTKNAQVARETAVKALNEAGVKNPTTQQIAIVGSELFAPGSALIKAFSKGPKVVKSVTQSIITDPKYLIPQNIGKARTFTVGGQEVKLPPKIEQPFGY